MYSHREWDTARATCKSEGAKCSIAPPNTPQRHVRNATLRHATYNNIQQRVCPPFCFLFREDELGRHTASWGYESAGRRGGISHRPWGDDDDDDFYYGETNIPPVYIVWAEPTPNKRSYQFEIVTDAVKKECTGPLYIQSKLYASNG